MDITKWNTEEAIAVSREEGRAEGMEAGRAETAIEMLKDGFSVDKVARYVKMPIEWVEGLSAKV